MATHPHSFSVNVSGYEDCWGKASYFPRFILSRIIPSVWTVLNPPPCIVRSLARKSARALHPTRPGGEWMGIPVPNLRRQLRLLAGGQRVRGSQSRVKPPSPKAP
ncbi:hypothetical protein CDAR_109991 [Caerostris darwini]|uniref:Uncharacterized protein n=1 Tax=Caerostris darwini TaxID=1538125 RepID=A0AAV4P0J8_9ARAC|nr:hypothetical protein CDAR_109991 [Caerostris darwini]